MIKSYFKTALRNINHSKFFSGINLFGLAAGMTVAILIGLWIYDELSYNHYHENHDRIAQVVVSRYVNGEINTQRAVPIPLGTELRTAYKDEFRRVVMAWWVMDHILSVGDKKVSQQGTFIEPGGPEMLSLTITRGRIAGLIDPSSILLSESAAKTLFGEADPMNQVIRIDNLMDVKVTGVYKDLPHNTRFANVNFFSSWDLWVSTFEWVRKAQDNWNNGSFNIFVEATDATDLKTAASRISDVFLKNTDKEKAAREKPVISLHAMNDWHLYPDFKNGKPDGNKVQFVWLFGIIGVFVLLLACINFMNLSTARSEKRAKEVGIRKAVGSLRNQLIAQFMVESFLIVALAFILAIALTIVSLPFFNALADKKMSLLWANPYFWLLSALFILITSLLSGSYPAFYLSSFQPVKVLKGFIRTGLHAAFFRKGLVVVQFTVSVILIVGTIIVYNQIQYAKDRPVGYDQQGLLMVEMKSPDFFRQADVLADELKKSGMVTEVALSSSPTFSVWNTGGGFEWRGKDPAMQTDFATISVTHEYGKTVGWEFIDGRDFSKDYATDSSAFIVNEAAARYMGLNNPVGQWVKWGERDFKVIGVIRDMVMISPFEPARQTIYYINKGNTYWCNMKVNPGVSMGTALSGIESVFRKIIPDATFDYKFADREYEVKFAGEERTGRLAVLFTALAIFISCLGLFGLTSFIAERRTKEIGIRKVLGASVFNLWLMLSKDFILLVTISCLIAVPVAWYVLNQWLQQYAYRTGISGWVFALAGCIALLIALITVSFQAIKAALANPVKSLRTE